MDSNLSDLIQTMLDFVLMVINAGKTFIIVKNATTGAYELDLVNALVLFSPFMALFGAGVSFFLGLIPGRRRGGRRAA